ncbi:endonuclease/exonuclease/phosphatase family protein [Nocardioides marmotae]|uniref:endonuclease/exonuclease/phosphatase family protein n=1 Tax=Nocardioides marmotae TaxID=2663857 RepID=UPI0012B63922|nr:endonuclease/exonuclease/phosphatase family protein [Nocardioides marmotae]MBC9734679.1 endonuclease/exonuclease/phosphatase family protein [Nocardioides marmotae]MTB85781.1 metal-dependent hydrolase [Nocardioides marmotae]
MHRGVHGLFALVALATIVALVVLWPQPANVPEGPGRPSGIPQPTGPSATGPSGLPTGGSSGGPTGGATGGPGSPGSPGLPTLPTEPAQTCIDPAPDGLVVLSFNIHGGLGAGGQNLERIAQEIEAWDADVVLLQEVDRFRARSGFVDQPTWLGTRLGMNAVYGRNVVRLPERRGAPRAEYGTALLSRLPVRRWENRMLPRQRGQEQRGLLRATLDLAGRPLDVYNTHLQHTRGTIRIAQLKAARRIVARRSGPGTPFVLGGDLNATPDSPALGVTRSFALDPWPVVGEGEGLTVPARVPRRRIDYVLHSPHLLPTSAQALRSAISDHRAVRVTFDVPRPGCGR